MEIVELKKLLEAGEWNDVEFKEARTDVPKSAYDTVSAFANTHGGRLVFGVAQHGETFELLIPELDKEADMASDLLRAMFAGTDRITPEAAPEVTPEVRRMLSVMNKEMTRGEIQKKLGLRDEKHFRESYQQAAVKLGLIEMALPDKPSSSKQRYRLTGKGRQYLAELARGESEHAGR